MTQISNESLLFQSISNDILNKGYSIRPYALPQHLSTLLLQQFTELSTDGFERAGIGRGKDHIINDSIRTDEVCWITNNNEASNAWITWTTSLQVFLNKHLFLGLSSFESHFAYYAKGDFYKKHKDAFKGEGNRVLSVVVYLNKNWSSNDGGELIIYDQSVPITSHVDLHKIKVLPCMSTVVIFLSEEFPHEVLPAKCDRYSIAGWFRSNSK